MPHSLGLLHCSIGWGHWPIDWWAVPHSLDSALLHWLGVTGPLIGGSAPFHWDSALLHWLGSLAHWIGGSAPFTGTLHCSIGWGHWPIDWWRSIQSFGLITGPLVLTGGTYPSSGVSRIPIVKRGLVHSLAWSTHSSLMAGRPLPSTSRTIVRVSGPNSCTENTQKNSFTMDRKIKKKNISSVPSESPASSGHQLW